MILTLQLNEKRFNNKLLSSVLYVLKSSKGLIETPNDTDLFYLHNLALEISNTDVENSSDRRRNGLVSSLS